MAIDESWLENLVTERKTEHDELAWSIMFLHLFDSVIRNVGDTRLLLNYRLP